MSELWPQGAVSDLLVVWYKYQLHTNKINPSFQNPPHNTRWQVLYVQPYLKERKRPTWLQYRLNPVHDVHHYIVYHL